MEQSSYQSGILFAKAYRLVRNQINGNLSRYGLTPTHWSLLSMAVMAPDGVRVTVVAEQMAVKTPMITSLSDDLIAQGLIERNKHSTDGRVKLLSATKRGKTLALKIDSHMSGEINKLLTGVSAEDITAFTKTLHSIIRNAS